MFLQIFVFSYFRKFSSKLLFAQEFHMPFELNFRGVALHSLHFRLPVAGGRKSAGCFRLRAIWPDSRPVCPRSIYAQTWLGERIYADYRYHNHKVDLFPSSVSTFFTSCYLSPLVVVRVVWVIVMTSFFSTSYDVMTRFSYDVVWRSHYDVIWRISYDADFLYVIWRQMTRTSWRVS